MLPLILIISLLLAGCSGTNQQSEEIERKQLFDFGWNFLLGDLQEASVASFNEDDWRLLDLQHDWSIGGNLPEGDIARPERFRHHDSNDWAVTKI